MDAIQRSSEDADVSDVSNEEDNHKGPAVSPVADLQHRQSADAGSDTHVSIDECEQSEPYIEARDGTQPSGDRLESDEEKQSSSAKYWPQEPQLLGKMDALQAVSLSIDLLATLLPVFFIVLSTAALSLDRLPRSQFGDNIIEASKYGTTAFPFVFGAVVSRLLKAIALWRCQHGARLGLLEQLVGSQSLVSAVERFLQLRQYDGVAFALLLLWAFSPFGSQMTLRLLTLVDSEEISTRDMTYFNISTDGAHSVSVGSAFESGSALESLRSALVTLVGTSMLASQSVRQSTMDQWGSVKIPYLDNIPSDGSWMTIDNTTGSEWTSLSGIMTINLPSNENSTFVIETAYIKAMCADRVSIPLERNLKPDPDLKSAGFDLLVNNISSPLMQPVPGLLETSENRQQNSNFLDTLDGPVVFQMWQTPTQINLVYGSTMSSNHGMLSADTLELFNCTLEFPRVEANISCQGLSCAVTQLRSSDTNGRFHYVPLMGYMAYTKMLQSIPSALGFPHIGYPSAIDQYVLGADNPFTVGLNPIEPGFHNLPGSFVAKRLTTLMNTVWQASLCPLAIGLGSTANLSSCLSDDNSLQRNRQATTKATTRRTLPLSRYETTLWHAGILLVISIFLQLAGILTTILMTITKVPNWLGYVSTLIKDNPYVAVPPGGSTLGGPERARYLAKLNLKLKIADVRADKEVGYLAFCSEPDEHYQESGKLQKGRKFA